MKNQHTLSVNESLSEDIIHSALLHRLLAQLNRSQSAYRASSLSQRLAQTPQTILGIFRINALFTF
jgi:hypothetical protein